MLIVISHPKQLPNEANAISALFEAGLEVFHLRKPEWKANELDALLTAIPQKYHNKIVLHKHIDVFERYNLRGFHFKEKNLTLVDKIRNQYSKSYSAHSFEELIREQNKFNYMFLSPVFKSISKDSYERKYSYDEIETFFKSNNITSKVLALGGVNYDRIDEVYNMGFQGMALLGAIWKPYKEHENIDKMVTRFTRFVEACKHYETYR